MELKIKQEQPNYATRNLLTVGIFGGGIVGFLAAMLLRVVNLEPDESATDWIMAVTAIVAVLISGLAVVLVAQTLQATQNTLKATQAMAHDQKRIGEAQTRPWVLLEGCEIDEHDSHFYVCLHLKNYGTTPAIHIAASGGIEDYEYEEGEEGQVYKILSGVNEFHPREISALGPSSTSRLSFRVGHQEYNFEMMPNVDFTVSYSNYDGTINESIHIRLNCSCSDDGRMTVCST